MLPQGNISELSFNYFELFITKYASKQLSTGKKVRKKLLNVHVILYLHVLLYDLGL